MKPASPGAAPPYVVALTGGIGSGKSTVAELFAARGAALVDTDAIAHALTAPGGAALPALLAAFGANILDSAGALDRPAMRALVFADAGARARLEAILHPLIGKAAARQCRAASAPYVILAVPLLVEKNAYAGFYQRVLVVDCSVETQRQRVMARSALDQAAVEAIIATQASRAARLARADDVINNDGAPAALPPQVDRLHALYLRQAAEFAAGA